MARRITSLSYTHSASQREALWSAARARKHLLLSSSDWTQLPDVRQTVSPAHVQQWEQWRAKVRSLKSSQFTDPGLFDKALEELAAQQPKFVVDQITASVVEEKVVPLDELKASSIENITELASLTSSKIQNRLGIVPIVFSMMQEEVIDFMANNPSYATEEDLQVDGYPFIRAICETTNTPAVTVVNNVLKTYTLWMGVAALLESTRAGIEQQILAAENAEVVKLINQSAATAIKDLPQHVV